LSSTTDRDQERGQALVVFTVFLFVLLIMAALAFDVGQTLLDRRTQQGAADAAALAGSRHLSGTTPKYQGSCSGAPSNAAYAAACSVAAANGFTDGVNGIVVDVKVPPGPESVFSGFYPGYISVNIRSTRSSIFHGRLLPNVWNAAAMGVAANGLKAGAPYSVMALNDTACPSLLVSGQGSIDAGSNIQVNSSCPAGAMQTSGQASVDVNSPGQINVVGDFQRGGGATVTPTPNEGAPWQPDPLEQLPEPAAFVVPAAVVQVGGVTQTVPASCPGGSTPSTDVAPVTCQFPSSFAGTTWRLFPGYYPGGLKFQAGTFYLEPGIYYLGGGGFDANGNGAAIYSVDAGGTAPPLGGGIMLFNSDEHLYHDACAGLATMPVGVDPAAACLGAIKLNGSSAPIHIRAPQSGPYQGIVIFQDRDLSLQPTTTPIASRTADIQINGAASTLNVIGTVYVPEGLVQANGNSGTASTIQIIADMFKMTGNNANLNAGYVGDAFFQVIGTGLVQ
jgi:hypothetical protein